MAAATLRLAHCSDLHLLSLDGVRWLQYANKRWLGAVNLLSNRGRHYHTEAFDDMVADLNGQGIDHVLCTGDITNLAFAQEFEFAKARFDRLTHGASQVTVLPGNHDSYVAEGGRHYSRIFAPHFQSDEGWAWPIASASERPESGDQYERNAWPLVRVRGEVAIIGLCTSLQTPWFTAWGRIGQWQRKRLLTALRDPRLIGKFRIVALHHPPVGPRAHSRIRGLRDWQAFAETIAEAGCELVLHGHEHRDMHEVLRGPEGQEVPVLGVQSGTYYANKPERTARYRIIEICNGRITGQSLRVWHPTRRAFDHDSAKTIGDGASSGSS